MVLRIGYVREHFSSPLLQFAEADGGKTFTLVECPGGTGQLIGRLTNDEIDIAIALTDALIAGIANGSSAYKLAGSFVSTPLNWAVITGKDSKYNKISDLRGSTIGISRIGSGSQVMASVMAMQQEWWDDATTGVVEKLDFKVNSDVHGLVASINDGSTSAFLWEWFTTKPWADRGEVRFIGSIPTPWPSWMIAVRPSSSSLAGDALRAFLASLSAYVREFDTPSKRAGPNVEFIKEKFGYQEEDIKSWLETVGYPTDCAVVDPEVVVNTLTILEQAGVVKRPAEGFKIETFVRQDITRAPESTLI